MKMFKKIIALLALVCVMTSSLNAFAAFSTITVTPAEKVEVKAGETVTVEATYDTLVGAKGLEIMFEFDNTAFFADTDDDTEFNYGSNKKPSYWPNYITKDMKQEKAAGADGTSPFFGGCWDSISIKANESDVTYVLSSTENYIITSSDEEDTMYPNRKLGAIFTVKEDAEPGDYTFKVTTKVSDSVSGVISSVKEVTVTVAGDEPVIEYEEKGDALTADKSVEAADGKTKWNDLAIYKASFNLNTLVAEQGYGFKVNNEKKAITITGSGTVDYVLAFFGVAADEVPAVSTYYSVVKANN